MMMHSNPIDMNRIPSPRPIADIWPRGVLESGGVTIESMEDGCELAPRSHPDDCHFYFMAASGKSIDSPNLQTMDELEMEEALRCAEDFAECLKEFEEMYPDED